MGHVIGYVIDHVMGHVIYHVMGHVNKVAIDKDVLN